MDAIGLDDCIYALNQTFSYYGKELDDNQIKFWKQWFHDQKVENVKRALLDHTRRGKYAPRIADLEEIIKEYRTAAQPMYQDKAALPHKPCPPEIAKAWMWYIGKLARGSIVDGIFSGDDVDPETAEQYLRTVNEQAFKSGNPDAIQDEHKLKEIWG